MPETTLILAPAKLNLALSVGPRRTDGMHPICSWMVTVDLHDELELTRLARGSLSRYAILWHPEALRRSEIDWPITRDLAVRAHLALEEAVGRSLPVQLKLQKRIPVGGGLGGGSSDAAAMLRGVNDLYCLGLSLDDLAELGAALGSDVPFLVRGGSAIAEGLGEKLQQHEEMPDLHAVIVLPEATCRTGRVYDLFDQTDPGPVRPAAVSVLADSRPGVPPAEGLFNDLAAAAVQEAPDLLDHLARLSALAERSAHVSGSGSALFIICDDPLHAAALAETIQDQQDLPALAVAATAARVDHPAEKA